MKLVALTGTAAPFPRLVEAVCDLAAADPRVDAWIQYGHYRGPAPAGANCAGADFVPRAEVLARLAEADVVVCHAGSGTIRDALLSGHTPVLVPRRVSLGEHVDDHQLDIAQALSRQGRAVVADAEGLARAVAEARARRGEAGIHKGRDLPAAVADEVERCLGRPRRRKRLLWPLLSFTARLAPPTRVEPLTSEVPSADPDRR